MPRGQPRKSIFGKESELGAVNEAIDPKVGSASISQPATDDQPAEKGMANLEVILNELRDFRQENGNTLREIKEEINKTNQRMDEAEVRITEAEERVQSVEDAVLELLKLQTRLETRLTDQEGRSRRENIRIHGIPEGAEEKSTSVGAFVETLLKDNLDIPASVDLKIERAHRALGPRPPGDATPRSIIVKFSSYRTKEDIIKAAWQKRGFVFQEKRINIDHDYAPEVLKKRKEYAEAKRVLKEAKIRFQTPFPAKMRIFFQDGLKTFESAAEATKEMAARGLQVKVVKAPESVEERIKRLTWRKTSGGGEAEESEPRISYKERLKAYRRS